MIERVPIQVTALAARQIREAEAWWRLHRTAAPNAIREELQRAFALIASQPQAGGRTVNARLPDVRRVYMPRIKYHVYYHVMTSPDRIEVVALWHARRGDGPPI